LSHFSKILSWYEVHKRDLLRRKTRDPYYILRSEVMSQQTQISRIIPKTEACLQTFPTIERLAKAKPAEVFADVVRAWA
jgi:A/G-specific adenine glycosylase